MLLFQPRALYVASFLVAAAALGAALVAQYAFGLKPCILCLWQRAPYALLLVLLPLFLLLDKKQPRAAPFLIALTGLLFALSAGLAFFHAGVEQRWWSLEGGCPVAALEAEKSADAVLRDLLATPQARCDEIAWRVLGISITWWNAALSALMVLYAKLTLFRCLGSGKNARA